MNGVASSLTNRIFLAGAFLVLTSIGLAIYRVNVSVAAQAEADLRAGLTDAASLLSEFTTRQFDDFVVKGSLIADLPDLKGAAATGHAPTVQPIAEDYQQRIGADMFVVVGTANLVLARAGRVRPGDGEIAAMLEACRRAPDFSTFWPVGNGVIHAAALPMEAGTVGTLLVGFSLDGDAAARMKTVAQSEIAFVSAGRVIASTLSIGAGDLADLRRETGVFTRALADDSYIGRVQPLGTTADAPLAVVLRSRTEHLRFLPRLRWQIAITGLAAVAAATVVGYLIARTVTRPLRALSATMGEMATTGDLTRPVPAAGRWDDED
ncbi:MAG TPA: HAMP domain-containing protein, partial [Vicinamibacterales bacterium]|nr:HAMP domain-containing protein [Vicinamibacterales bacterium]